MNISRTLQISDPELHHAMLERFQNWASQPENLVILDTETTGLPKHTHAEVWQLGAISFTPAGTLLPLALNIIPVDRLRGKASEKTKVWHQDLEGQPQFLDAYPFFAALVQNKQVLSYNFSFDYDLLQNTCRQWGVRNPIASGRLENCVMRTYADYRQESWHRAGNWSWVTLEHACELEGVELDFPHSALFDALATWELIQAVVRNNEI